MWIAAAESESEIQPEAFFSGRGRQRYLPVFGLVGGMYGEKNGPEREHEF